MSGISTNESEKGEQIAEKPPSNEMDVRELVEAPKRKHRSSDSDSDSVETHRTDFVKSVLSDILKPPPRNKKSQGNAQ